MVSNKTSTPKETPAQMFPCEFCENLLSNVNGYFWTSAIYFARCVSRIKYNFYFQFWKYAVLQCIYFDNHLITSPLHSVPLLGGFFLVHFLVISLQMHSNSTIAGSTWRKFLIITIVIQSFSHWTCVWVCACVCVVCVCLCVWCVCREVCNEHSNIKNTWLPFLQTYR